MNRTQTMIEGDERLEDELVEKAQRVPGEEGEQEEPSEDERERMRERRHSAMDDIGSDLMGLLSEAVQYRAQFERDWVEDTRQFEHGDVDRTAEATKQYTSDEEYRSVTDNITRPATITFAARLGDLIHPTNDRNWDLDATPDPELPEEIMASISAGPDGRQLTENELYTAIDVVARKRMDVMRRQIDDQLSETSYADHGREVIMDACKLGHGVMKGPFAQSRKRRRYAAGQGYKAVIEEILTDPKAERIDPWLVFPLPCRRINDAQGVFQLHEMSAKKVADLRFQPGFSSEQVGRLLKQAPAWDSVASSMALMRQIDETVLTTNRNYAMFEYNGEMPKEALEKFLAQLMFETKLKEEDCQKILGAVAESNSIHLHCNVWMSQGYVVKIAITPIEHQHNLYKFFVFEEREGSPFGKGVPRLLRDPQQSVRMLWAAIMLNSMMSSAPQIGVKKGSLLPMGPNGGAIDMRCTRPKVWAFNDEVEDIEKAFQVFIVPNTTGATMAVYERAKKNGEEQVMLPMIAQGEPNKAVPTSSGLAMLMNASNIVQRRLAARYDAMVTTPLIVGFYDWNMEFGKAEAKGDYKCVARASSHLLVKDMQAQHFLTALNLYSANPVLAPRMKIEAWAEEGLRVMDVDVNRFLYSQSEMDEMQTNAAPAEPDAETLKAKAALMIAEARMLEAQNAGGKMQADVQLQTEDRKLDYEDRIADRGTREKIAAMNLQAALADMDATERMRVMEMANDMEKERIRSATQTRTAGMRAASDAQKVAAQFRLDQQEIAAESTTTDGPRLL
jgi:hypothetical protein